MQQNARSHSNRTLYCATSFRKLHTKATPIMSSCHMIRNMSRVSTVSSDSAHSNWSRQGTQTQNAAHSRLKHNYTRATFSVPLGIRTSLSVSTGSPLHPELNLNNKRAGLLAKAEIQSHSYQDWWHCQYLTAWHTQEHAAIKRVNMPTKGTGHSHGQWGSYHTMKTEDDSKKYVLLHN